MGVTREWAADAPVTISGVHRQDFYATLFMPTGLARMSATDMEVTYSEDWAPRIQGSLTAPNEYGAYFTPAVDPRTVIKCQPVAGYIVPGYLPDLHPLATTHLTSRTSPDNGETLNLVFSSVEALAQDCLFFGPDITYTFAGVKEAIAYMIGYVDPGGTGITASSIANAYRADLTTALPFEAGRSLWDHMDDLALLAGVRVQADGSGGWRIATKVTVAGAVALDLTQGKADSIAEKIEDSISRQDYFNAALLKYEWKDTTGVDKTIYGSFPTGGVTAGWGKKAYYDQRRGPVTQASADAAAKNTVRALSARGDSYSVDAVAAYWLRDGDTVRVRLATGATVLHIVRAVTFHLSTGRMTVTTREPSNLGA
jgi:hypothetical protein